MILPNKRVQHLHFIGIGGAGMSGIAEVLAQNGFAITGSDMENSSVVEYLRNLGVQVFIGHQAQNIHGADLVVFSSAVHPDNPEMQEAARLRIPTIRRAEMLGELMRLKYTLAVAGTHGKTSTTSMVGAIFEAAQKDPTVIVGGVVQGKGSGAKVGRGEYLVAESDEFDRSFLRMMPSSAIITNIDADHLDCYRDLDEIKDAFVEFANKVPFYGQVILCIDDSGNREILSRLAKPVITYGFSPQATYRVVDWKAQEHGGSTFSVQKGDELLGSFEIQLLGKHNTLNACAAIALASEEGIDPATIARALFAFQGVERRMQLVGNLGSTLLFDDYAHHPTETAATLKGLRDTYPDRKIVVVFQPHLFSRTRDQYEAFGEVFVEYSDALLVTDIYPARELPIEGVTGALVSESASRKGHRNAFFVGAKENAVALLQEKLPAGSVVVLMGAGSIWHLAQDLKNAFSQEVSA